MSVRVRDSAVSARSNTYSYDAISRLATVTNAFGSADAVYDGQSTLTRFGIASYRQHYFIDPNNIRMTQTLVDGFGAIAVSYDLRGHTASAEGSGFAIDKGDQLRSATRDCKTVRFDYDANSTLVRQSNGDLTTYMVFDSRANLLGQYRSDGSVHREMVWLDGRVVGLPDGDALTIHTNAVGSTIAVTTASGTLAGQEAYFAFGKRHGHIDPSADPVGGLWFTGRTEDPTAAWSTWALAGTRRACDAFFRPTPWISRRTRFDCSTATPTPIRIPSATSTPTETFPLIKSPARGALVAHGCLSNTRGLAECDTGLSSRGADRYPRLPIGVSSPRVGSRLSASQDDV